LETARSQLSLDLNKEIVERKRDHERHEDEKTAALAPVLAELEKAELARKSDAEAFEAEVRIGLFSPVI